MFDIDTTPEVEVVECAECEHGRTDPDDDDEDDDLDTATPDDVLRQWAADDLGQWWELLDASPSFIRDQQRTALPVVEEGPAAA